MLRLGIDIGSTTSKAVLLNDAGDLLASVIRPTGHEGKAHATQMRDELMQGRTEDLCCVSTGYGRSLVEFAEKTVTEITCHARGVHHLAPDARTIIDIGGQDSKAIRLSDDGRVEDFAMNDRCAAGTGAFLDVIARKFGRTLEDISELTATNPTPLEISSTCVVFAESEVVGLIAQGKQLDDVLAGVHKAIARRTITLVRQLRGTGPFVFSGGVALNGTMRHFLAEELGEPVAQCPHPQLTAAVGAALLASA